KFGADISAGFFGWNFRGEVALQTGVKSTFWRGDLDLDPDRQRFPVGYQRPDDLILQFVLGAEVPISYGQSDTLIVGLEYFYNDAGYENSDLYTWMLIRGDFTPLFVGRQYAGLYVAAPYPFIFDDTTINFTTLANVSDGSWLLRLDYRV